MSDLSRLLDNNRRWAERMERERPGFFQSLKAQQKPRYMWIGCADSRVPANEIIGLPPGEVFVHRNVANLVVHSDLNCLSVLDFAVNVLRVDDIIVCGHYNCGGVNAALNNQRAGLVDNWLRHVQDVRDAHQDFLNRLPEARRLDAMVELNVLEQARNVCRTTVVQDAWQRGQSVTVHGWVYGLHNGLLEDLSITAAGADDVGPAYAKALAALQQRHQN